MSPNGIYWLASFPKSGNTWFRIVLRHVLNPKATFDLNHIDTGAIASSRGWIDNALSFFDSAWLRPDELEHLLPKIYQYYHDKAEQAQFHKVHTAYTYLNKQKTEPLIPPCLGAIYIIRNPLDVAISYANHAHCTIDEAIILLGNAQHVYCGTVNSLPSQIRHYLGSWSFHVKSWTEASIPLFVIRYEDMKKNPFKTFCNAMNFLNISTPRDVLISAIEHAKIEKLQQMEVESGFIERPINTEKFFRKGIVGDWKATLTSKQVKQIVRDHAIVMQKYGYLDESLMDFF